MGVSCCKVGEPQQSSTEHTSDERVSSELLLDMLEKRASVLHPEQRTSHKVLINLELVETILMEEEQEDAASAVQTSEPGQAPPRRGRKGTGFVTKEQVAAALEKSGPNGVSFSDEGLEVQEAKSESRTKARKPTGYVTKEKLLHALENMSDEEDEDGKEGASEAPAAAAVVSEPEPAPARNGKRKGTGFVSKKQLQKVIDIYGEEDE
mmetsp:Transcript_66660/g.124450  ORF Transcript_66660/g.124450 Transcript_66660/m.124450 type:complete len:208 (-) Transcript_66660:78-701(-)